MDAQYDVEADINAVREACKGAGTNEKALIALLCNRPRSYVRQLNHEYRQRHHERLLDLLIRELSGKLEFAFESLVRLDQRHLLFPVVFFFLLLFSSFSPPLPLPLLHPSRASCTHILTHPMGLQTYLFFCACFFHFTLNSPRRCKKGIRGSSPCLHPSRSARCRHG